MANQTKPVLKGDIDNLAKQFHKALNHAWNLNEIYPALLQAAPHKILSPSNVSDVVTLIKLLSLREQIHIVLHSLSKPIDLTATQAD